MTRLCLVVLCGLPASGKTIFSQTAVRALSSSTTTLSNLIVVHICYDELMPLNVEQYLISESNTGESKWKMYRRAILNCVHTSISKLLHCQIIDTLDIPTDLASRYQKLEADFLTKWTSSAVTDSDAMNVVFIIDDNMFYSSMRHEYYQMARHFEIGFGQVYLSCGAEVACDRNAGRSAAVSRASLENMSSRLEPPDTTQTWQQHSLTLDQHTLLNEQLSICKLRELILSVLANPVRQQEADDTVKEQSRLVCSTNVTHQTDHILRKLVSDHMIKLKDGQNMCKALLREEAGRLNRARTSILKDMKEEKLLLPQHLEQYVGDAAKNKDNSFHLFVRKLFEQYYLDIPE